MSSLSSSQTRPLAALLSSVVMLTSAVAFAVPISPGTTVKLNGTSTALRPELASTVLTATSIPFSCNRSDGSVLFKGTLQHDVARDAWGYLDFYYRIIVDPSSPGWVTKARATSYVSTLPYVDTDWRMDGLGDVGPYMATRDAAPNAGITYSFQGLYAGKSSRYFFVQVKTPGYKAGGALWLTGTDGVTTLTCGIGGLQQPQ
jgi:hypothetical protein